jgi:integrase
MASLFRRDRSPYWWVKFRDSSGRIRRESTMHRLDSTLGTRKAKELAMLKSLEEFQAAGATEAESRLLSHWVPQWIEVAKKGPTAARYRQVWVAISTFLEEKGITLPEQITRGHVLEYFARRKKGIAGLGPCRTNTALTDLRILRAILFEAVRQDWIVANPASRLGIKSEKSEVKAELTIEDIALIRSKLPDRTSEMRVAFEIALHQGCRLRETSLPLDRINIAEQTIAFEIKGGGYHVTMLHPELVPLIQELKATKRKLTYDYYPQISRDFSRLFKRLKLRKKGLTFHSTRVTAITRLARSGKVSEQQAMRFIGHATASVHRIYQRLGASDLKGCLKQLSGSKNLLSESRG